MQIIVDGYDFNFPAAKELYKFDETNSISPHYHGVSVLKAVDVMAEFDKFSLWIEIKCYSDDDIAKMKAEGDQRKSKDEYHVKSWLRNNLVRKYHDTFLYRYAEDKINKPIVYVCLLNFDSALRNHFRSELRKFIPCDIPNKRWKRKIISSLCVLNEDDWKHSAILSSIGTCRKI